MLVEQLRFCNLRRRAITGYAHALGLTRQQEAYTRILSKGPDHESRWHLDANFNPDTLASKLFGMPTKLEERFTRMCESAVKLNGGSENIFVTNGPIMQIERPRGLGDWAEHYPKSLFSESALEKQHLAEQKLVETEYKLNKVSLGTLLLDDIVAASYQAGYWRAMHTVHSLSSDFGMVMGWNMRDLPYLHRLPEVAVSPLEM